MAVTKSITTTSRTPGSFCNRITTSWSLYSTILGIAGFVIYLTSLLLIMLYLIGDIFGRDFIFYKLIGDQRVTYTISQFCFEKQGGFAAAGVIAGVVIFVCGVWFKHNLVAKIVCAVVSLVIIIINAVLIALYLMPCMYEQAGTLQVNFINETKRRDDMLGQTVCGSTTVRLMVAQPVSTSLYVTIAVAAFSYVVSALQLIAATLPPLFILIRLVGHKLCPRNYHRSRADEIVTRQELQTMHVTVQSNEPAI